MDDELSIIRIARDVPPSPNYSKDSAARIPEMLPNQEDQLREERIREERRRRWEKNIRKRAIERETRTQIDSQNLLSRAEARVLAAVVGILLASCVLLVYEEASVGAAIRSRSRLQTEYTALQTANSILSGEVEQDIEYSTIYEYAVKKLRMEYPEKYQIITYEREKGDELTQNETIPSGN